jgi:hypothetical protein
MADYSTKRIGGTGLGHSRIFVHRGDALVGWMDHEGDWTRNRGGLGFSGATGRLVVTVPGEDPEMVDSAAEGLLMVARICDLRS